MMFQRADRLNGIELSEIVQISEAAARLRAEGRDVLALSTGEPDLPTPPYVVEAAHSAALEGKTKYPPTAGVPALRVEIARQAGAEMTQVIVSTGAKQVIANAMLASLNPGDEVIMPAPYWTSYSDIVRMAGGVPVVLPCPMEQGFKLLPEQLEAAITPRTRWLMLNSPSNPSGSIYSKAEISGLFEVLERHTHVWILADEIYRHLSYVPFASVAKAAPALTNRVLIVNGVAKAWSMTGWRIGWGIGPTDLIRAMVAVQGQVTSGACSISQWASLAAITCEPGLLEERRALFATRRDLVVDGLNAVPGLRCSAPDGAFYAFPSCTDLLKEQGGPFDSDAEFCTWLLEDAGVALVPGRAFGMPGHLRLSFAYAEDTIAAGLARLKTAVERKLA